MAEKKLPKDWDRLLERFAKTLAQAEDTLARASALDLQPAPERGAVCLASIQDASAKAEVLPAKAKEITEWVDSIDSELKVSEDLLRVLLTQTEAVREKLATWAGRAIG